MTAAELTPLGKARKIVRLIPKSEDTQFNNQSIEESSVPKDIECAQRNTSTPVQAGSCLSTPSTSGSSTHSTSIIPSQILIIGILRFNKTFKIKGYLTAVVMKL